MNGNFIIRVRELDKDNKETDREIGEASDMEVALVMFKQAIFNFTTVELIKNGRVFARYNDA